MSMSVVLLLGTREWVEDHIFIDENSQWQLLALNQA